MAFLQKMYRHRFEGDDKFRTMMYDVLCKVFFQKFIPKNSTVLDVAAGHCEFINAIEAKEKIALDLNPDVKKYASKSVRAIIQSSVNMKSIRSESVDVVFCSNFFEHLERKDIVKTINEIYRVLKKGGKLLVLQPNIRYCAKDYWMFFDHITALDDRSTVEVLELNGFLVKLNMPRFLPYTTKSSLPKSLFLLRLYLRLPIVQRLVGGQAFIVAEK